MSLSQADRDLMNAILEETYNALSATSALQIVVETEQDEASAWTLKWLAVEVWHLLSQIRGNVEMALLVCVM